MGGPDKTHKMLLGFNDEFAEVFGAFALKGRVSLDPCRLREAQGEYQHIERGKAKELRRDVVKMYDGYACGIVIVGIENQMRPYFGITIKTMGYDWARYAYQLERREGGKKRQVPWRPSDKSAYHCMAPVISHVLNFSYRERWNVPTSIHELVKIPPGLEDFVQDYKIHVTDVAWLTEEERAMLTGDFRILADALYELRTTGQIRGTDKPVKRVETLMAALAATTHRQSFLNPKWYKSLQKQEGDITMCEIMDRWEARLKAEGRKDGWDAGRKDGWDAGCKHGAREREQQIALSMIRMHLDNEVIAQATSMQISDIQELRKNAGMKDASA